MWSKDKYNILDLGRLHLSAPQVAHLHVRRYKADDIDNSQEEMQVCFWCARTASLFTASVYALVCKSSDAVFYLEGAEWLREVCPARPALQC